MIGSVGRIKGIPRPGLVTIEETFNLLSALGSGDAKVKKILTKMKDVQAHNEKVLNAAKDAVAKADKREEQVAEKETELTRNLKEAEKLYAGRVQNITNREEELHRMEAKSEAIADKRSGDTSVRENAVRIKQEEHQASLGASRLEFEEREKVLEARNTSLEELESSIKRREKKIVSDKEALEHRKEQLDNRQFDLDKRDERVRAAMEGS